MSAHRSRVLITGGTGLLGLNWAAAVRDRHEVVLAVHERRVSLAGALPAVLPLEDEPALLDALRELRPGIVVHAAGLSSVDGCERDPEQAIKINAALAGRVARAAAAVGARLVHISTDHLFDGTRALVAEDEAPRPLNAYARSKLEGERLVTRACPQALILRTNFFGWGHATRESISDWILTALRGGQNLRMFDDLYFTPILASELARAAHQLLDLGAAGVVHVCGDERVSKYDFAMRLAAGFDLSAGRIERSSFSASALTAPRPRDMSLSNARARGILGRMLGGLDRYFTELRGQEEAGLSRELRRAVTE